MSLLLDALKKAAEDKQKKMAERVAQNSVVKNKVINKKENYSDAEKFFEKTNALKVSSPASNFNEDEFEALEPELEPEFEPELEQELEKEMEEEMEQDIEK